jgi:hypothetical protein
VPLEGVCGAVGECVHSVRQCDETRGSVAELGLGALRSDARCAESVAERADNAGVFVQELGEALECRELRGGWRRLEHVVFHVEAKGWRAI